MKVRTKHFGIVDVGYRRDPDGKELLTVNEHVAIGKHQNKLHCLLPRDFENGQEDWDGVIDAILAGEERQAAQEPAASTPAERMAKARAARKPRGEAQAGAVEGQP